MIEAAIVLRVPQPGLAYLHIIGLLVGSRTEELTGLLHVGTWCPVVVHGAPTEVDDCGLECRREVAIGGDYVVHHCEVPRDELVLCRIGP